MNLVGKTAVITGASGGIGQALAWELARVGIKRLLLLGRNRPKLAELAGQIQGEGVEVVTLAVDLTQPVGINIALAQAWRSYGPIEILINCAGVAHQAPFVESPPQKVEEEIALNLLGMMTITRLMARRMIAQREGLIVNVSSLMGKVAAPTMASYSATKFAIVGFTQALRRELAPYNVKVLALLPSLTDTEMVRDLKLFRWVIPLTPEEVAQALIRGLEKNRSEIWVGWQSHAAKWCQRIFPWLLEQILLLAVPGCGEQPRVKTKFRGLNPAQSGQFKQSKPLRETG